MCHFHRRTTTRWYFTESCKTFTGLCHNHRRSHRRTIELQKIYGIVPQSPMTFRRKIPTELRTSRSARMSDTCPSAQIPTNRKVSRDFQTFLVRISINFRQYYRRKLMPPTTINFRRKNCNIKPPLPLFGSFFLWLCFFFIFSSPFIWLHLAFLRDLPLFGGSFKRYVFFFLYLCIFLF